MGTEPLAGIRVLDLTNVLAGPYCCYQLGLMGAEVIKVERPGGGDLARQLGADPERNAAGMGVSFLAQNAGKRSVTLDLKAEEGKELLRRLVRTADVLVENFRPGVMERLGLGPETLRAENPRLIYCAISGFGQDGPWRGKPAYDQIVQGVSGVMSVTGDADSAPLRVGYPLADTMGGMTAAFAIAAKLAEEPRGGVLDISMTEAVISSMGWVVSNHLLAGTDPQPVGNENPTSAPSGCFATADMPINIAANRDEQWEALARHLGLPELIERPDYATREHRKANRHALRAELEAVLTTKPAEHWIDPLNALGVPTGPVLSVPQVLETEQVRGRGLVAEVEGLPLLASPVVSDGVRPVAGSAPPALGQDNEAVFGALGLSPDEIAALAGKGIL
ncbi:CaiB/BaiF CoA transferase family protein [Pontivivens ytuae]|uniref:CoA transferase n=1 Tax=Pontivivens ytuae TaxID=2789856 RepID=A0A7S9LS48_9RHOB|nr:CoA transferase [Pontivivens ytuae]QPH54222.1 CoA transferase [Pontivivens ytuae]